MITLQVLHKMGNMRKGISGYAALKVDFAKAYDSLSWDFIHAVLT